MLNKYAADTFKQHVLYRFLNLKHLFHKLPDQNTEGPVSDDQLEKRLIILLLRLLKPTDTAHTDLSASTRYFGSVWDIFIPPILTRKMSVRFGYYNPNLP